MNPALLITALLFASVQFTFDAIETALNRPFLISSVFWTILSTAVMYLSYGLSGALLCLAFNIVFILWWRLFAG